jgi:ABC-type xylose transport system permease subunit
VDLRKLRNGDWIALAGGIALIVSLFLPWYGAGGDTANGWQSLTVIDVVLCICALFGIAQWFFAAQQPTPAVPLAAAGLGAWTGLLAILLTVIRLIDAPADGLSVQYGAFVALIASITLFAGAWRSLGDERIRMPDGRWSRPAGGEIAAGVEVKALRPSRSETTASESP